MTISRNNRKKNYFPVLKHIAPIAKDPKYMRIESQEDDEKIESVKPDTTNYDKNFDQEQSYGLYKPSSIEKLRADLHKYSLDYTDYNKSNILESLKNKRRLKRGTIIHNKKSTGMIGNNKRSLKGGLSRHLTDKYDVYNFLPQERDKKTSSMLPINKSTVITKLSISADSTANLNKASERLPVVDNCSIFTCSNTKFAKNRKRPSQLFKLQGQNINRSISVDKNELLQEDPMTNMTQVNDSGMIISTCGSIYKSTKKEVKNIRKCLEKIVKSSIKQRMKLSRPALNSYVKFKKNNPDLPDRTKKPSEEQESNFKPTFIPSLQTKPATMHQKSWKILPGRGKGIAELKKDDHEGSPQMKETNPEEFLNLIAKQTGHYSYEAKKQPNMNQSKRLKTKSSKPKFIASNAQLPKTLKKVGSLNEDLMHVTMNGGD
ncbi:unnamed protein product [Moneuplotes crassus]|uniref:Uncharacterized protein n=1 Tax=Euplotes crassus TaxID=5936 RepID=A0AAD1X9A2_EUPCR|nr:unnamed protein product [Moneuplotes crassus]